MFRILFIIFIVFLFSRDRSDKTRKKDLDKTEKNRPGPREEKPSWKENLDIFLSGVFNETNQVNEEVEDKLSEIKKKDEINRKLRKEDEAKRQLKRRAEEERIRLEDEKTRLATNISRDYMKKEIVNGLIFSEILSEPVAKRKKRKR